MITEPGTPAPTVTVIVPMVNSRNAVDFTWSRETLRPQPTYQVDNAGQPGDGMRGPKLVLEQYFGRCIIDFTRRADYETGNIWTVAA